MKIHLPEPVTLCIINYNGLTHLQEAVAALQNLATHFDEILIIDNASTDGSLAYLQTLDNVTVLALTKNNGPAGARNAGFQKAKHDIILFQDNDICLTESAAQTLYAILKQDENTLLTVPRVVYKENPDTIQFESADCHFLGMMALRLENKDVRQVAQINNRTSSMVTACFMMDRRRWDNDQLFDEKLIFNLEDHDLGVRANLFGFNITAVPAATVLHGSGTPGFSYRPGNEISDIRMYCLIRNRWWIIFRYYSRRSLVVIGPLLFVFEILQFAGLWLKGFRRVWVRALMDTGKQLTKLKCERQLYQKQRKRPDCAILKGGNLPLSQALSSGTIMKIGIKMFEVLIHVYWQLVKQII